jgi:ABC-type antimicrobial peptide transport system permease subunit
VQCVVGVAIGIIGAAACARLLASLLFQTSPLDPLTFAGVTFVLIACCAIATAVPALRAARTQPAAALRYE